MQIREMSDQEFQRHALAILQRELGAEGFAGFLGFLTAVSFWPRQLHGRAGSMAEGRHDGRNHRANSLWRGARAPGQALGGLLRGCTGIPGN
jgi:hypothetical protein